MPLVGDSAGYFCDGPGGRHPHLSSDIENQVSMLRYRSRNHFEGFNMSRYIVAGVSTVLVSRSCIALLDYR